LPDARVADTAICVKGHFLSSYANRMERRDGGITRILDR
jgi:hypothetical protein